MYTSGSGGGSRCHTNEPGIKVFMMLICQYGLLGSTWYMLHVEIAVGSGHLIGAVKQPLVKWL